MHAFSVIYVKTEQLHKSCVIVFGQRRRFVAIDRFTPHALRLDGRRTTCIHIFFVLCFFIKCTCSAVIYHISLRLIIKREQIGLVGDYYDVRIGEYIWRKSSVSSTSNAHQRRRHSANPATHDRQLKHEWETISAVVRCSDYFIIPNNNGHW